MGRNAYRAIWLAVDVPETIPAGGSAKASATVLNDGPCVWMPSVHLGYRIYPAAGGPSIDMPERAFSNRRVKPGESIRWDITVKGPPAPGRYDLEFDLVQENVAWFTWRGGATARIPVVVH
jgi:hypothetical protein